MEPEGYDNGERREQRIHRLLLPCLRTCFTSSPFQSSSLSSERSGEQSETRSEEAGNKSSV